MDVANLKQISFFSSLNTDELNSILKITHELPFQKDQEIIQQGRTHASLFLVLEGVLHVNRKAEPSNVYLGRIETGSFFGEISFFDPGPASASVRAMGGGRLYEIRREDFFKLIEQQPALGCKILTRMMHEMANRLRRVDQRLGTSVFWESLTK
ncbi:MAG: cyclic nucleotide-binding domain-containing protein [Verrucomicrobiae bacterium]|nr:cyclic nucleotide-binding domain-containing protein [Verrucomicrobiae bacterium]